MDKSKLGQIFSIIEDNKQIIKLAGIITSIGLFLGGYLQNIIINGSIMLYLSYSSFKVLGALNDHPIERDLMVLLIKKWILFTCLMIVEHLTGFILHFPVIGLGYNISKLFFLVLLLQNSEHLTIVYDIVGQGFAVYEEQLDKYIELAEDQAKQFRIDNQTNIDQYNLYSWMNSLGGYIPWLSNSYNKKQE